MAILWWSQDLGYWIFPGFFVEEKNLGFFFKEPFLLVFSPTKCYTKEMRLFVAFPFDFCGFSL